MGPFYYVIVDIQGDYAQLRRTDIASDEILPVAMALLPMGSDIGTKLCWQWGVYEIIT
ncbi:MAG: chorismate--pyruvate lyase [Oscillospiraceae bacterium]|nr:chorismate--pyruvate lyase [Oscillospiraceae bacterium]